MAQNVTLALVCSKRVRHWMQHAALSSTIPRVVSAGAPLLVATHIRRWSIHVRPQIEVEKRGNPVAVGLGMEMANSSQPASRHASSRVPRGATDDLTPALCPRLDNSAYFGAAYATQTWQKLAMRPCRACWEAQRHVLFESRRSIVESYRSPVAEDGEACGLRARQARCLRAERVEV